MNNFFGKATALLMSCAVSFTSVDVSAFSTNLLNTIGITTQAATKSETDVIEVNELESFVDEVSILSESDNLDVDSTYATQRLIVVSDTADFDNFNASSVVCYDNIYILSYDTRTACKKAYQGLQDNQTIKSVEVDSVMETENATVATDTVTTETKTELKTFLDSLTPATDVKVAILDTGIDVSNQLFENRFIDLGINLSSSGYPNSIMDDNGHGTEMATIIVANSNEHVKLMPIKVANSDGKATVLNTYLGIQQAVENNADVINISMTAAKSATSEILTDAINTATEKGIIVVVSAGNNAGDTNNYAPANIESAIVVSAVDAENVFAEYSNHGTTVDYAACGVYNDKTGTSYAAANVTGMIADVLSKNQTVDKLNEYAIDLGTEGRDDFYGDGFVGMTKNDISAEDITSIDEDGVVDAEFYKNLTDFYEKLWSDTPSNSKTSSDEDLSINATSKVTTKSNIRFTAQAMMDENGTNKQFSQNCNMYQDNAVMYQFFDGVSKDIEKIKTANKNVLDAAQADRYLQAGVTTNNFSTLSSQKWALLPSLDAYHVKSWSAKVYNPTSGTTSTLTPSRGPENLHTYIRSYVDYGRTDGVARVALAGHSSADGKLDLSATNVSDIDAITAMFMNWLLYGGINTPVPFDTAFKYNRTGQYAQEINATYSSNNSMLADTTSTYKPSESIWSSNFHFNQFMLVYPNSGFFNDAVRLDAYHSCYDENGNHCFVKPTIGHKCYDKNGNVVFNVAGAVGYTYWTGAIWDIAYNDTICVNNTSLGNVSRDNFDTFRRLDDTNKLSNFGYTGFVGKGQSSSATDLSYAVLQDAQSVLGGITYFEYLKNIIKTWDEKNVRASEIYVQLDTCIKANVLTSKMLSSKDFTDIVNTYFNGQRLVAALFYVSYDYFCVTTPYLMNFGHNHAAYGSGYYGYGDDYTVNGKLNTILDNCYARNTDDSDGNADYECVIDDIKENNDFVKNANVSKDLNKFKQNLENKGINIVDVATDVKVILEKSDIMFTMSCGTCGHTGSFGAMWVEDKEGNLASEIEFLSASPSTGGQIKDVVFEIEEPGNYVVKACGIAYGCRHAYPHMTIYGDYTISVPVYQISLDTNATSGITDFGTKAYFEKFGYGNYVSTEDDAEEIRKISVPSRKGYIFDGYYAKDDGTGECYVDANGKILSGSETFAQDTTIYAKWIPLTSKLIVYPDSPDAVSAKPEWAATWNGSSDKQELEGKYTESIDIPLPQKIGYTFVKWLSNPDTLNGTLSSFTAAATYAYGTVKDTVDTITATWKANDDTKYVVKHHLQDLNYNSVTYTLKDTQKFAGTTDAWLTVADLKNSYNHFTYKECKVNNQVVDKAQILPDGSLEINLYYTRDKYKIETSAEGSGSIDATITGIFYDDTKTISYKPANDYYLQYLVVDGTKITGKDLNAYLESYEFANISKDHEIKAVFKTIPQITVTTEMASRLKNVDVPWDMVSLIKITGTDYLGNEHTYYRSIEGAGSVTLKVPAGTYTVSQLDVDRWKQTAVTGVTHCTVSGTNGVCDTSDYDASVKFANDIADWSEYSDNDVDVK